VEYDALRRGFAEPGRAGRQRGAVDLLPRLGHLATAVDPGGAFKSIAGLAIGLTTTIDILAAGPLTGAG
jgi:hypothetical protein